MENTDCIRTYLVILIPILKWSSQLPDKQCLMLGGLLLLDPRTNWLWCLWWLLGSVNSIMDSNQCIRSYLVILMPILKWSSQLPSNSALCSAGCCCLTLLPRSVSSSSSDASSPGPKSSIKRCLPLMESALVSFWVSCSRRRMHFSAMLRIGNRMSTWEQAKHALKAAQQHHWFCDKGSCVIDYISRSPMTCLSVCRADHTGLIAGVDHWLHDKLNNASSIGNRWVMRPVAVSWQP